MYATTVSWDRRFDNLSHVNYVQHPHSISVESINGSTLKLGTKDKGAMIHSLPWTASDLVLSVRKMRYANLQNGNLGGKAGIWARNMWLKMGRGRKLPDGYLC